MAKRSGMLKLRDPEWCKGNQFEMLDTKCEKCGSPIHSMRATLKSTWRSHGKVLCSQCRPKSRKPEKLFTRRRVKYLAKSAVKAIESNGIESKIAGVDYEPIKAPPPPIRRSRSQYVQSADMMVIACRMDLDNQILFWRFIDGNSIIFTERSGKSITITRHPTNGQMRLDDMAKNSISIIKEIANETP